MFTGFLGCKLNGDNGCVSEYLMRMNLKILWRETEGRSVIGKISHDR